MAELLFVGAGLDDEQDLSRRAIAELRRCDALFVDDYTSVLAPGAFERLGVEIGLPAVRLDRAAVEEGTAILGALDAGRRVGFLVAGDPFAATTHVALRLAAEARGHTWRYFPNASILTAAAGFLGLQPYRFGRTVSLPFPSAGFTPTSPLEMIAANRSAGLHTLLLLDLRPAENRFLTAREALAVLAERDPDGRWLSREASVAVVARVGSANAAAWYASPAELADVDFGPPLHAVVVPAPTLHFEEEAALARYRVRTR